MAGWRGDADVAYDAAPRDATGAWAVFGKNMDKLPKQGKGMPIAGRLVAQAAKDAPMFKDIQQEILAYLGVGGKGGDAQKELDEIAAIAEIAAKKGTIAQKVRAYVTAGKAREQDCQARLAAAVEEATQARKAAQKAAEKARNAADTSSEVAEGLDGITPQLPSDVQGEVEKLSQDSRTASHDASGAARAADDAGNDAAQAVSSIEQGTSALVTTEPTDAVEDWASAMNALFRLVDKTIVTNETMLLYTDDSVAKPIKPGIESWSAFADGVKAIVNMCVDRQTKGGLWTTSDPYTPTRTRITQARKFTAGWYRLYEAASSITAPFGLEDAFTKNVIIVARGLLYVDFLFMLSAKNFAVEAGKSKVEKTFGAAIKEAWNAVGIAGKDDYMSAKMGATPNFHELGDAQAAGWTDWYADKDAWKDLMERGVTEKFADKVIGGDIKEIP